MINPSDIANELKDKLSGVTDNIYISVPSTRPTGNPPFIVTSVDSSVIDKYAYYYTESSVQIFVYNLSNGTINGTKLGIIIDAISSKFPIKSDNYYFDVLPTIIPLGNDDKGYNVTEIKIKTLIYKK